MVGTIKPRSAWGRWLGVPVVPGSLGYRLSRCLYRGKAFSKGMSWMSENKTIHLCLFPHLLLQSYFCESGRIAILSKCKWSSNWSVCWKAAERTDSWTNIHVVWLPKTFLWENWIEKPALDRSFHINDAYVCSLCMHETSFSINKQQRADYFPTNFLMAQNSCFHFVVVLLLLYIYIYIDFFFKKTVVAAYRS